MGALADLASCDKGKGKFAQEGNQKRYFEVLKVCPTGPLMKVSLGPDICHHTLGYLDIPFASRSIHGAWKRVAAAWTSELLFGMESALHFFQRVHPGTTSRGRQRGIPESDLVFFVWLIPPVFFSSSSRQDLGGAASPPPRRKSSSRKT